MSYHAKPQDGAVWITGASTGIGRETAIRLAQEGFTVYASARSQDKLAALASQFSGEGDIIALPLDVTDRDSGEKAVEKILSDSGGLSLAIFNAGNFFPVRARDMQLEAFEKTFDINVFGVLTGLIPAVRAMLEAGRGQIALVASSAGYGGLPKSAAYGASKAAVINMAESLRFDLERNNIRIQVVTPGFVKTPLTEKNDFPMPFLMEVEDAADALVKGLKSNAFDITFPKRFTYLIKAMNLLPYRLYFPLVARFTGSKKQA